MEEMYTPGFSGDFIEWLTKRFAEHYPTEPQRTYDVNEEQNAALQEFFYEFRQSVGDYKMHYVSWYDRLELLPDFVKFIYQNLNVDLGIFGLNDPLFHYLLNGSFIVEGREVKRIAK